MNSRRVFSLCASILLVSLGLGIVYLVTTERLSVGGAVAILIAVAALTPAALTLRDLMTE